jgi:hypothetical protein
MHGRPADALRSLRESVKLTPPGKRSELERRLYWLSIALLKLGSAGLALKSLASAQKLRPKGQARRLYQRYANGYGMERRGSALADDYHAFRAVQLSRYLNSHRKTQFDSRAEAEMAEGIVIGAFKALIAQPGYETMGIGLKLKLFKEARVDFPLTRAAPREEALAVDFRRGRCLEPEDRCSCGSGLSYAMCCGRIECEADLRRVKAPRA